AVGCAHNAIGAEEGMAVAFGTRHATGIAILIDDALAGGKHAVDHGNIDKLPDARSPRFHQRHEDADHGEEAGYEIPNAWPDLDGRLGIGSGDPHHAAHRLPDDIERWPGRIGTLTRSRIAKSADRRINEPGIARREPLIGKVKPLHYAA